MINGINAGIIVSIVVLECTSQFFARKFYESGTTLLGYFVFSETFIWQEFLGLGLVILGAVILGVYSEDVSKS